MVKSATHEVFYLLGTAMSCIFSSTCHKRVVPPNFSVGHSVWGGKRRKRRQSKRIQESTLHCPSNACLRGLMPTACPTNAPLPAQSYYERHRPPTEHQSVRHPHTRQHAEGQEAAVRVQAAAGVCAGSKIAVKEGDGPGVKAAPLPGTHSLPSPPLFSRVHASQNLPTDVYTAPSAFKV